MAEQTDVKVFISWSGDLAKDVAIALREWLPLLFDRVSPWASDTDIAAGQRGLRQIEAELEDTRFGVVVVTAANQHAPWLNFEAGALSKTIRGDVDQRVVPLLVDLIGPSQLTGPLAQFQAKAAQREGLLALVQSLASVAGIGEQVAAARFEAYWPQLEERIEAAKQASAHKQPKQERRDEADLLDEILLHLRALRADGAGSTRPPLGLRRERLVNFPERPLVDRLSEMTHKHNFRLNSVNFAGGRMGARAEVTPLGEFSAEDLAELEQEIRSDEQTAGVHVDVMALPLT